MTTPISCAEGVALRLTKAQRAAVIAGHCHVNTVYYALAQRGLAITPTHDVYRFSLTPLGRAVRDVLLNPDQPA